MSNLLSILKKVGVVVAAVWVGGCFVSTTSPTYTTPTDLSPMARSHLADYCAKRTSCAADQSIAIGACPTSMCLSRVFEEAPLIEALDCQIAKQCTAFFNDDDCFGGAGTSDAERDAFLARCSAKTTECGTANLGDPCMFGLPIVRKEFMRAADACLGRACADVQACVDAIQIEDCWGPSP